MREIQALGETLRSMREEQERTGQPVTAYENYNKTMDVFLNTTFPAYINNVFKDSFVGQMERGQDAF